MVDVITVGSGNVDVFVDTKQKRIVKHQGHEDSCYTVGGKQLIRSLVTSTGGGGSNSAVGFSRMGLTCSWLGIVGDDSNGDTILSHLKTEKVKFIGKRKKGLSGYSVILVSLHHDRSILVYKGVNNLLSVKDFKMNSLCPKWFYMSSLMGVGFQTTKKIALYAKKNNIPFAFNPSMYLAKYGLSKLSSLVSGCSLLVLNLEEANALCSTRNKTALQVIKILSTSTHRVVITDGANGATGFDGKIVYILHATKCKNVESTGAGDAMATGIVAGLIKGKSFDYSLRLGYAQSTSVIGYVGAKAGLLSYSKLISRVKKQKIKVLKKPLK